MLKEICLRFQYLAFSRFVNYAISFIISHNDFLRSTRSRSHSSLVIGVSSSKSPCSSVVERSTGVRESDTFESILARVAWVTDILKSSPNLLLIHSIVFQSANLYLSLHFQEYGGKTDDMTYSWPSVWYLQLKSDSLHTPFQTSKIIHELVYQKLAYIYVSKQREKKIITSVYNNTHNLRIQCAKPTPFHTKVIKLLRGSSH